MDLDEGSPIVSLSLGRPGRPYVLRDDIFAPKQEMEAGGDPKIERVKHAAAKGLVNGQFGVSTMFLL